MSDPDEFHHVLLVEYQKAQDSAEHHDNLVGSVTSLWLGSAVLMGFVLNALSSSGGPHHRSFAAQHKTALVFVIALGIGLTFLVWSWVERAVAIKQQKYNRCKEIEALLGMKQHSVVGPGKQWKQRAYRALIAIFLAAWGALLADVVG